MNRQENSFMIYRFRPLIIAVCSIIFSLWWFGAQNFAIETIYTHEDFCQDISRIYNDLGDFALKRGDYSAAHNAYNIAIEHRPDHQDLYKKLELCAQHITPMEHKKIGV